MKMLNNEIKILKGEKIEEEKIKQTPLIEVNNHIDNNYVSEEELKLTIHKMINNITNIDSYNDVKKELEDRFGRLDNNMIIYMNEELFESYLRNLEGKILINNDLFIEIVFSKEISEKIDYEDLIVTSLNISKDIIFSYKNNKLHIKLKKYNKDKSYIITLNNLLEKMC